MPSNPSQTSPEAQSAGAEVLVGAAVVGCGGTVLETAVVVVVAGVVPEPLQAEPFSFTLLGAGVAGPFATNPMLTWALLPIVRFQDGAVAVTVVPETVTSAFQPLWIVTPEGTVNVTVHGVSAAPLFSTVTAPW
jgi:hypothetical protein